MSWTSKWRMPIVRLRGLADDREDLGQQVVEVAAVARLLAERGEALPELVVVLELELGLEGVDQRDALLVLLELLALADVQRTLEKTHETQASAGPASVSGPSQAGAQRAGWMPLALARGPRLAALAALVAVALDLARELVLAEVQRVVKSRAASRARSVTPLR